MEVALGVLFLILVIGVVTGALIWFFTLPVDSPPYQSGSSFSSMESNTETEMRQVSNEYLDQVREIARKE